MTFDSAVAEYQHRTGHPRPWTRQQEEDALDGLSGWLRATRSQVTLEAVTPQLVSQYAAERHLDTTAIGDLNGTLACLRSWARAVHAHD